ncbi:MAG: histidine phosphatase family protein [Anaerolineales bacterium]|nr:histidine phosphatase family protein [Anaerolineales bacterium]
MHLFLIRHGESWTNVHWREIEHNHQLNSALTEYGLEQAQKLAAWMKSAVPELDGLYTSTLHRARETAAPIEEAYALTAVADHRLREGGYSFSSGEPIPDELLPIHKRVDFHAEPFTPFEAEPPGVESFIDLRNRVSNFLTGLVVNHSSEKVAVITHGWTLNAFMDVIFNVGPYRSVLMDFENTSVSWFEYRLEDVKGPWRMHFLARTPHLGSNHRHLKTLELEAS